MNSVNPTGPIALLTETELRLETKKCADREKIETANLLKHLIEIERRKLYLKWGHGSLFNYLTDELGYERGSASLRVSAVKAAEAIKDLPKKIESGALSLKAIRTVESFAYHEAKAGNELTKTEKLNLYKQIENLSVTKVEEKLANIATSQKYLAPIKEVDRAVKGSMRVIQFTVTEKDYQMLQLAKEVLSHKYPGASSGEIYKHAVEELVTRKHPKYKASRAKKNQSHVSSTKKSQSTESKDEPLSMVKRATEHDAPWPRQLVLKLGHNDFQNTRLLGVKQGQNNKAKLESEPRQDIKAKVELKPSRYIAAKESHAVWLSYDDNGCTYTDPATGKRCRSKHKLQRDHKVSFAAGGSSTKENLEILCAKHNLFKAQTEFGFD